MKEQSTIVLQTQLHKNAEIKSELDECKFDLQNANEQLQEFHQISHENKLLRQEKELLERTMTEKEQEIEFLSHETTELRDQEKHLTAKISELQQLYADSTENLSNLHQELKKASNLRDSVQAQNAKQKKRIQSLQEDNDHLKVSIDSMQASLTGAQQRNENMKVEYAREVRMSCPQSHDI